MTQPTDRGREVTLGDLGLGLALVVVWVLAWGDLSVGNVLSGALVATALIAVFPVSHDVQHVDHRLRPLSVLRVGFAFVFELALSNLVVARDVLGGRARERTGIVACPLRVDAPGLITFLTNVTALTPGTMPLEVTHDPPVLYLHVLRLEDPAVVRAKVSRFEELAVAALGSAAAVAACRVPPPPPPGLTPDPGAAR